MKNSTYYLLFVIFLAACGSSRKAIMLDELNVNASNSRYRESTPLVWDITHTEVAISFNFEQKTADGHAILTMHPYFYASDKIVLDAKSMEIHAVLHNGQNTNWAYSNDTLTINLVKKYNRDEQVLLDIKYTAKPNESENGGSAAIRDDRGLYFINTDNTIPGKPVQIWTQGETQATSHWVPTFDQPNERFTTAISITVPDSFVTLSNGMLTHTEKTEDGMRTDKWEMDKEIQPYVMMMAVGKFAIVEESAENAAVHYPAVDVNYYVEPAYAPYAKDMFRNTPEMIDFFSRVTCVPYPWNKYSQVVVRDYVSGAMENTSASLFGEFIQQTSREIEDDNHEDVVSHELFHQWFGDYVTAESWSNLTLNESFATYGEQLWRRYKYGQASEEELAFDDLQKYLNATKSGDQPLVRFHYNSREDMFDRISYQKGASILHYLHGLLGDEAFYKAMNIYLSDNALSPAEVHHWRLAIEKVTGKDWNLFFNQWYFDGGHPKLTVDYKYDDKKRNVAVTYTQEQDRLYTLPLKTRIIRGTSSITDSIILNNKSNTYTYEYIDSTRPVIIPDADHWVVGTIEDNKTPAEWLAHFNATENDDYILKLRAIRANMKNLSKEDIQKLYKNAIADNLESIRSYAVQVLYNQENKAVRELFTKDIIRLAKEDLSRDVRAYANAVIGEWEIEEGEQHLYQALSDTSYKVAAEALRSIRAFDEDTVYTLSKQLLSDESQGDLTGQVWANVAAEGEPSDTTWLKQTTAHVLATGKNKMVFAAALAVFMQNTPANEAFNLALGKLETIILSESIGVYRSAMASFMFDVAYYFKNEEVDAVKKGNEAKAKYRSNKIRDAILRLESAETDKDNLAEYKKSRAQIYGIN